MRQELTPRESKRNEALRLDRANLFRREIDNCHHKLAYQFVGAVQIGNLCAGLSDAEFLAEIHAQDKSWLSSFGKSFCRDDFSHSEFDFQEIVE